jgi:hypothetical protein
LIGDLIFQSVKIGGLDLLSGEASFHGMDFYEDLNDPFGSPLIEINVVDPSDALNKYKLTGDFENNKIEIKYKYEPTGEVVGFNSVMHSNKNLQDRAGNQNQGSLHSKQYCIRGCQPELLNVNRNPVQKNFSGPTTKHVETIFKDYAKSEKQFETRDESEERDKTYSNEHPVNATQDLLKNHTSKKYKSSAYTVFQEWKNGNSKIVQTTYEQLFEQSPVVTLKERTDLNLTGITEQDQQNSIMWAEYDPSWTEPRAMSRAVKNSYNPATNVVVDEKYKSDTKSKTPAYKNEYKDGTYLVSSLEDTVNNSKQHTNADARRQRAQFTSHLMQGTARIEVPYNPKITLGSIVQLDIPKKTDNNQFGGEGQFNKKALVVAVHHKIKPAGQRPGSTMILELAKAGMEQGGASA